MTSTEQHDTFAQFATVDTSDDPTHFFRILDMARQCPGIAETRQALMDGLALQPGHRVLDAGCGLGWDTVEFARVVGPTGVVIGVDLSSAMVEEAARRAAGLGLPVRFAIGDITKLEFPDESFDACRTERVLLYVPELRRAVSEMVRVTKRGGRVSMIDTDFETLVIDHPDPDMCLRVGAAARDALVDGRMARKLPRLMTEAGLVDVTMSGQAMFLNTMEMIRTVFTGNLARAVGRGDMSEEEVAVWWKQLQEVAAAGPLVCCITLFVATGTKP